MYNPTLFDFEFEKVPFELFWEGSTFPVVSRSFVWACVTARMIQIQGTMFATKQDTDECIIFACAPGRSTKAGTLSPRNNNSHEFRVLCHWNAPSAFYLITGHIALYFPAQDAVMDKWTE